jgi:hypothetical protein
MLYAVAESKGKWVYCSWVDCGKLDKDLLPPYAHGWITEIMLHVLLKLGIGDHLRDNWHVVVFDQYFSSPTLFALLLKHGIYAVGTCQKNRRGFPTRILSGTHGDNPKTLNLGQATHVFMTGTRICAVRWMDKKDVCLLSNYHYDGKMVPYESKKKGQEEPTDSEQPTMREDYNDNNNGVDIDDQKNSAWIADRQSKKFMWHRVFQYNANQAVTLATEHYRMVKETLTVKDRETSTLLNSRHYSQTARWNLFNEMAAVCQLGRVGPEPSSSRAGKKHRAGTTTICGKCAILGCKGRTKFGCVTCGHRLCYPKCHNRHWRDCATHPVVYKVQRTQKQWKDESDSDSDIEFD